MSDSMEDIDAASSMLRVTICETELGTYVARRDVVDAVARWMIEQGIEQTETPTVDGYRLRVTLVPK